MAEEEKLRAMSAGQRGGRKTLKDIYTAKIAELEALSREWREKQKKVKEGFKANLEQVQAFQALKQLLQLKLASLQADGGAPADAPAYQRQALDVADINRSIAPVCYRLISDFWSHTVLPGIRSGASRSSRFVISK